MTGQELADALIATFEGTQPDGVVISAAVVEPGGSAFAASEQSALDAVFEFGSITKALTGTLLAALVQRGVLALDDNVGKWLDGGPNADITVLQLATHTSGLPRLSPNAFDHEGFDKHDPYARFSADLAEVGLHAAERSDAGSMAYSNFGFQLLGLLLERAAAMPYGDLMAAEVFAPLGMSRAQLRIGHAIDGHNTSGNVVAHWSQQLPGSGGIEGAITDLAALATAVLARPDHEAGRALAMATSPHFEVDGSRDLCLGWSLVQKRFLFHNGGSAGFSSSLVIDTETQRAVALLANVGELTALDSAGFRAAAGDDPTSARPTQPSTEAAGDEFVVAAAAFANALRAEDYPGAVAGFSEKTAQTLTAERIREVWAKTLTQCGPVTNLSEPTAFTRPFGAAARVDITLKRGALALHTAHDETTAIIGVLLIGPEDAPPF